MSMLTNTLGRYFAGRFVVAALGVFAGIFLLLVLVDYIEMVPVSYTHLTLPTNREV